MGVRRAGMLTTKSYENKKVIQYYSSLAAPRLASIPTMMSKERRPTHDMLRLVLDLNQRLQAWDAQRASCKASARQAAAQSVRTIIWYCESILALIETGNIDADMLEFEYKNARYRLRDVIETQQAEMQACSASTAQAARRMECSLHSLQLLGQGS